MENGIDLYNFIFSQLAVAGVENKEQDICSYSPLTLAYMGDAVYELAVRSLIVTEGNAPVNKLHKRSSDLVKAETQAKMALYFVKEEILDEDELRILKRGRNAQSYTKAKNARMSDYRWATGFEALVGYLYLSGNSKRMMELIGEGLKVIGINEA